MLTHSLQPEMKQEQERGDAGIELFITIPIYYSDPLFLRRGKGEDFRSIKKQARVNRVLGVPAEKAQKRKTAVRRQMGSHGGMIEKLSDRCKNETEGHRKHEDTMSSSSLSVISSSSSMSDLFVIDEKDMIEWMDERSNPRFRRLAELYCD